MTVLTLTPRTPTNLDQTLVASQAASFPLLFQQAAVVVTGQNALVSRTPSSP